MAVQEPDRAVRLSEIAAFVGGRIVGSADGAVSGASSLDEAGPADLAFVSDSRFVGLAQKSRAAAFVVGQQIEDLLVPQVVVDHAAYAFARIVEHYFTGRPKPRGVAGQVVQGEQVSIGPEASIWPFVTLGNRVRIGARVTLYPGVFIGDDSVLGDNVLLYPNVTVREGTIIGSRVVIHSGTVIGSDGFGYVQHQGRHQKIPQIGAVTIEDDVELGANVTVDRATFGRTVIKRGTKVDNLVQVAHNVTVGEDSILVAQVGIAGSSSLGHHVMVGGQVGISDHVSIGDMVMIAARSGVTRDVPPRQIVSGAPAMPHEEFIKAQALFPLLPELRQHIRKLEERVRDLEAREKRPQRKSPARKK